MSSLSPDLVSLDAFQHALEERYRLERELGQGGMATVYLAQDLANNEPVAIKVLLPELAASIGADRFLREIEVGRTLQHPNIVGVLDSGKADDKLYYVMPFVEGASLRDKLDRQKQLGIEEAVEITKQVALALDFAHSKGVIHRDIKPENILLSGDKALVADFGIARAVTVAGGEKLTKTGMAVGTPTYMSPEQALGSKDVTAQSDIYSLACVLFELLAGQPPFTGPTPMALLARHSLDNVPSIQIVRTTVPDAVQDAIERGLAKVPADRFASAADFAKALDDHQGAAVRRHTKAHTAQMIAAQVAAPAAKAKRLKLVGLLALPVVMGIAGWGGWKVFGSGGGTKKLEGPTLDNIAVLYFDDRSPGKSLAYLSDGLTEALIHELSAVTALHVISRNGVAPFKGKSVGTDSIRKALKVGTLVNGSVLEIGDTLQVSVELTDSRTGESIGETKIRRPKAQSFELQDALAKDVSSFLRKSLGDKVQVVEAQAGTKNAQAYEALQRARQMIGDYDRLMAAGNAKAASAQLAAADTAFAGVAAMDKNWMKPEVERAWVALKQSRLYTAGVYDVEVAAKFIETGLVHAEKAVAMSPKDADALEVRGSLKYWNWLIPLGTLSTSASAKLMDEAEKDLTASVTANPNQASAWNWLSHLRFNKSEIGTAKLAALRAFEADPYLTDINKTVWRLFNAAMDMNSAPEARKWCKEGSDRFPADFRFSECKLWLLMLKTTEKPTANQIWKAYDDYIAASPPSDTAYNRLKGGMLAAIALIRAGQEDSARAVAVRSRGTSETDPTRELTYWESIVRAQLKDKDEAFKLIRNYLAMYPQQQAGWGGEELWWYEDLRTDPRWDALKKG